MENQGNVQEEVDEAMEMLGKGYHDEPALEIEAARKVTERRGGKLIETERGAFVKIYTSFKGELKDIEGDDLKVWFYLALSINRFTNDARPGLRKIAEDTGLAVNTVRAVLERLELRGLLDVEKSEGKPNVYHPSDYVSVKKETVSKFDTPRPTVSKSDTTVSKNGLTVSSPLLQNAQLEELEELENTATPLSSETFLEFEKRKAQHKDKGWEGREQFRDDHLLYADWWNSISGQPAKGNKSQVKSCQKAFSDWHNQGLDISSLQHSYDARLTWKKFISDPNELTKDAAAIQALPKSLQAKATDKKMSPLEQALHDLHKEQLKHA